MHLTQILLRGARKYPKGNIFRGKYRIVEPVTHLRKAIKIEEFKIEERNMFLLRHPYLTEEEELVHLKDLDRNENFRRERRALKLQKFIKHTKLTDHLSDLRYQDKWE
ncbi:uncharacterized protein LOC103518334 [Diaphorina citri]|uniref:Uncharacterized protein LOC103518334 n=1 Tax=Diaphorina citri TaxID=121845 RepID=A0A1S3DH25_DIACI|nr:uncharacterized protein LOC103518334 [Diaphorina citri]XP_026685969.1 uncharacterized protein LOC103518334 [Diaphorina citri]KAI5718189.1 hypothetical protein M8J77_017659 [Diaphorina citri]